MVRTTIITATNLQPSRLDFLHAAHESVQQQSTPAHWIVCLDSDDKPPAWLKDSAQIVRSKGKGVSAARNTALEYVTTPYVCTLDDDDILSLDSIKVREDALSGGKNMRWVAAHISDLVDNVVQDRWEQPLVSGSYEPGDVHRLWQSPENYFIALSHTFLLHTEDVLSYRGWPDVPFDEDIAVISHITRIHSGCVLDDVVLMYRKHKNQTTHLRDNHPSLSCFQELAWRG